ncbi:hypothetical protein [Deinococcus hopiensis]|uniref:hypothetical protein n=1 Tax=Deinococcus hopiensis TaxID=309885 RepID=UPI001FEB7289|nr:hypothetical protein [Deinococcus hopiensis]
MNAVSPEGRLKPKLLECVHLRGHPFSEEITLTAKLKLNCTPQQKAALDAFSLSYRDALNHTAKVAYEMGKSSNASKIQQEVDTHLRERFGLKAQSARSVPRRVGAFFKQLLTKFKDHQKKQTFRVEAGLKPRRFKGFDAPPSTSPAS